MKLIEKLLFDTESIIIAGENEPFWYTSGTIGPYFINTHYLYGGEKNANELLEYINSNKDNTLKFINEFNTKIMDFYNSNYIFKNVIDYFLKELEVIDDFNECEYISGGERRDWFFSPVIAGLTGKKHLYIYKDLKIYNENGIINDLNNGRVCHICDLITKASSHQRAWIPAINQIGGKIVLNASLVDRDEGGMDYLISENIKNLSLVVINDNFLNSILNNNIINKGQLELILNFKKAPQNFGKNFLLKHPDFLKKSLQNPNTSSKAQRCIDEDPYNLNLELV